ncbi:5-oxoprolinase subunit B family protein [Ferruginibacter profundus]
MLVLRFTKTKHDATKNKKEYFFTRHCIYFWLLKIALIISPQYFIAPLNETALLVNFENVIDEGINQKIIALHQEFSKNNFIGFIETVPAYCSLAVFYNAAMVKKNNPAATTAFEWVKNFTMQLIHETTIDTVNELETITMPVYYNGEDLEYIATQHQLSVDDVISIHTAISYRVYMIGFLPGFAYMGKVDERIFTPRLATPRTNVKAGSVGIAGFQTGIYPLQSPGGWQLIGQTPIKIFDTQKKDPCLLKAGDKVQFVSISKADFEKLNEY